jgi:DNA invertase Pin-like site-specific DNA recombinase
MLHAALAERERKVISERTIAALARLRGFVVGRAGFTIFLDS